MNSTGFGRAAVLAALVLGSVADSAWAQAVSASAGGLSGIGLPAPTVIMPSPSAVPAAMAVTATPTANLWSFLGVPQTARGAWHIGRLAVGRVRRLLPIGRPLAPAPGPLPSDGPKPLASAAVENKQKADAVSDVTVEALAFLAEDGCIDVNPDTATTVLESLNSPSARVRLQAVRTVWQTAAGCCRGCRPGACCTPEIVRRLEQMGYEKTEDGLCYLEVNPSIRRQARRALATCNCCGERPAGEPLPEVAPVPTDDPHGVDDSGTARGDWPSSVQPVGYMAPPNERDPVLSRIELAPVYVADVLQSHHGTHFGNERGAAAVQYESLTVMANRFADRNAAYHLIQRVRSQLSDPAHDTLATDLAQVTRAEGPLWLTNDPSVDRRLWDTLAGLSPGEISQVMAVEDGYRLYRVLARRPAGFKRADPTIKSTRSLTE